MQSTAPSHTTAHFIEFLTRGVTRTGLGLDGRETARENFPLPTLSPILRALAEELHHGCGFFALRGLDPNKYSREDNIIIFLGISSYVGEMRGKQDDSGHLFGSSCPWSPVSAIFPSVADSDSQRTFDMPVTWKKPSRRGQSETPMLLR